VGPSGSGKSTLARALAGLVPWAVPGRLGGAVGLDDLEVGDADPAALVARVGVVFQDPSSQLVMERAGDDVAFGLEGRAWPRAAMLQRVPQALADAGLAGFERRRTARLSGGEQQRLALARAAALGPEVLFLDEPCASLDPAATRAVEEIIRTLAARGTKIVMTTHDLGQARRLAGEVVFLHRGRVREHADAAAFFTSPATPEAAAFLRGDLVW
jgi:tungstate transport system ATP-binding protein